GLGAQPPGTGREGAEGANTPHAHPHNPHKKARATSITVARAFGVAYPAQLPARATHKRARPPKPGAPP
ncbi:hypothetical protein, partial [Streptomyces sp. NPDC058614]|uniref:hypothetical protein n=1 Tax=Streptomyces sp. NPDC058614 TaxID=3346557 RepID=UPI00364E3BC4